MTRTDINPDPLTTILHAARTAAHRKHGIPPHIERADLEQDALEALLRALPRHSPDRSPLAAYCAIRAGGAVQDALRRYGTGRGNRRPQPVSLDEPTPWLKGGRDGTEDHKPTTTTDRLTDPTPGPHEQAAAHELADLLEHAILNLPAQQQFVIRARYWAGLTHSEIADCMRVSEARIHQIHRAATDRLAADADLRHLHAAAAA